MRGGLQGLHGAWRLKGCSGRAASRHLGRDRLWFRETRQWGEGMSGHIAKKKFLKTKPLNYSGKGRTQGAGDIGESNVATWHDFIPHTKTHALSPGYATTGSGFACRRPFGSAAFPLTVLRECRPAPARRGGTLVCHHTALSMPASLLYEATQALTKEELSALGSNGLLELCALDRRFHPCAGRPALRARARVMRSAPPPASPAPCVQV